MGLFVNFIKEYGSTIIAALSVIVGIVAVFVKRRPKTLDDFTASLNEVLSNVPYFVNVQERRYGAGHGDEKKAAVLVEAAKLMKSYLGRELSPEESEFCLIHFNSMVEAVLTAPQKKGVDLDGKKKLSKS